MVKLNCINQKACLINWNHETYNTKQQFILKKIKALWIFFFTQILFSSNFMDSILMISLNINKKA